MLSTMLVHRQDIPIVLGILPAHTAINTARLLALLHRTPIVTEIRQLLIETVMVTRSVLRRLILIRMVTPLRLIVIDMVIPQERIGAIRIVSETPQQLILTLMAKEKVHQAPILTATETLPRPIRTVMDKALALPPAIRIRLGIPLLSSVAIMKKLPSGHGKL